MTREEELKKELEDIELAKKNANIQKNLDKMTLVGKYFASHQLNRYMTNKPSYNFNIVHITGKEYKESNYQPYYYTGKTFYVHKDGDKLDLHFKDFASKDVDYYKYEITKEEFDTVINTIVPSIEKSVNEVRNKFIASEYVSGGDYTDIQHQCDHLDNLGVEYIDFADNKYKVIGNNITLLELLRWNNHPFLYNSKLYKLPNWIEIIISIRDKMREHAYQWGGVILERDYPRIELLTKFINDIVPE